MATQAISKCFWVARCSKAKHSRAVDAKVYDVKGFIRDFLFYIIL